MAADGCRAGWVALVDGPAGRRIEVAPDAARLFELAAGAALLAIDIPIGLPGAEPRACDVEARRRLGPRRASVFPAPPRAALVASTHAEATAIARRVQGRGMSVQTFHLLAKIREVDAQLRDATADAPAVAEVHPELSFAQWRGEPMAHPKRDPRGREARRSLIGARYGTDLLDAARRRFLRRDVATDDLHDAFAVLWTAHRVLRGEHVSLPAGVDAPTDAVGLPMQIVA